MDEVKESFVEQAPEWQKKNKSDLGGGKHSRQNKQLLDYFWWLSFNLEGTWSVIVNLGK